jgi:hypothetical protein
LPDDGRSAEACEPRATSTKLMRGSRQCPKETALEPERRGSASPRGYAGAGSEAKMRREEVERTVGAVGRDGTANVRQEKIRKVTEPSHARGAHRIRSTLDRAPIGLRSRCSKFARTALAGRRDACERRAREPGPGHNRVRRTTIRIDHGPRGAAIAGARFRSNRATRRIGSSVARASPDRITCCRPSDRRRRTPDCHEGNQAGTQKVMGPGHAKPLQARSTAIAFDDESHEFVRYSRELIESIRCDHFVPPSREVAIWISVSRSDLNRPGG